MVYTEHENVEKARYYKTIYPLQSENIYFYICLLNKICVEHLLCASAVLGGKGSGWMDLCYNH